MGSLKQVLEMVEKARTVTDEDDPAELPSSEEVAQTVEKTVTLVGQVVSLITYERRKNVLTTMTSTENHKLSNYVIVSSLGKIIENTFWR